MCHACIFILKEIFLWMRLRLPFWTQRNSLRCWVMPFILSCIWCVILKKSAERNLYALRIFILYSFLNCIVTTSFFSPPKPVSMSQSQSARMSQQNNVFTLSCLTNKSRSLCITTQKAASLRPYSDLRCIIPADPLRSRGCARRSGLLCSEAIRATFDCLITV